jgi:hypothetical protein
MPTQSFRPQREPCCGRENILDFRQQRGARTGKAETVVLAFEQAMPNSFSRALICALAAGCDTLSRSDAWVRLPNSATAANILS